MPYRNVRALARGLDVLAALNGLNGATAVSVSERTGIHRTTVHRLLETLRLQGFVYWSDSDETYRISHRVQELSIGYREDARLVESAAQVLPDLVRRVRWPSDLATLDGDMMVVRESSHQKSPCSLYQRQVGSRWPVLGTAIGRAYLAFCGDAERRRLTALLRRSARPNDVLVSEPATIEAIVRRTRRNGYAESCREADSRVSAIAVPVYGEAGRVVGCVNLIFFASAFAPSAAAERFLPALNDAARGIERAMRDYSPATCATAAGPLHGALAATG
jgi:IclR family mhp operon transcriptional activator